MGTLEGALMGPFKGSFKGPVKGSFKGSLMGTLKGTWDLRFSQDAAATQQLSKRLEASAEAPQTVSHVTCYSTIYYMNVIL